MSIIKRKKQDKFFMMSNQSAQQDLENLSSIGLLAYIISLPSDFKLYKTYLQNKFTRRTVDGAFKELTLKRYIAGFSAYVNRCKTYYYIASDEPLTEKEFNMFVHECFYETVDELNAIPKNLQPIKDNQFNILIDFSQARTKLYTDVQNVQHSDTSDVQYVQYLEYSTPSTVQNEQIQINNKKKYKKRNTTNIKDNNKRVKDNNFKPNPEFDVNSPTYYNWLDDY